MVQTIWKYELGAATVLMMPKGAEVLSVASQNNTPHLWAVVDETQEKEERAFLIIGTGHLVPNKPLKFIGTVLTHDGALVLHVFEILD